MAPIPAHPHLFSGVLCEDVPSQQLLEATRAQLLGELGAQLRTRCIDPAAAGLDESTFKQRMYVLQQERTQLETAAHVAMRQSLEKTMLHLLRLDGGLPLQLSSTTPPACFAGTPVSTASALLPHVGSTRPSLSTVVPPSTPGRECTRLVTAIESSPGAIAPLSRLERDSEDEDESEDEGEGEGEKGTRQSGAPAEVGSFRTSPSAEGGTASAGSCIIGPPRCMCIRLHLSMLKMRTTGRAETTSAVPMQPRSHWGAVPAEALLAQAAAAAAALRAVCFHYELK